MMTLDQARVKILDLWIAERRLANRKDYAAFFKSVSSFYQKLLQRNKGLLKFNYLGDKWQVVNKWIREYENGLR